MTRIECGVKDSKVRIVIFEWQDKNDNILYILRISFIKNLLEYEYQYFFFFSLYHFDQNMLRLKKKKYL